MVVAAERVAVRVEDVVVKAAVVEDGEAGWAEDEGVRAKEWPSWPEGRGVAAAL